MLILASVKPGELVYDLGAGDGRILSSAVREFDARAVGVELHASRYEAMEEMVKRERLGDSVRLIRADFLDVDLTNADIVTLYLLTSVNSLLKPKLERELKPGARVVSHDFPIRGWVPSYVEKFREKYNAHLVYVYQVPSSLTRRFNHLSQPSRILRRQTL